MDCGLDESFWQADCGLQFGLHIHILFKKKKGEGKGEVFFRCVVSFAFP